MMQTQADIPQFSPTHVSPEKFISGQALLIDKPLWWTSFDVVRKCRNVITQQMKIKKLKVGHAGTLDPLATGLMIVCTGGATKRINEWVAADKEYCATIELGRTTPSFDLETDTDATYAYGHVNRKSLEASLGIFLGHTLQTPPLYSAKYVQGKRAYTLARDGSDMELPPQSIHISALELVSFELPVVKIRMRCSKGTYVRSFARDLGRANLTGACLIALRRTAIGNFSVEKALTPDLFEQIISRN